MLIVDETLEREITMLQVVEWLPGTDFEVSWEGVNRVDRRALTGRQQESFGRIPWVEATWDDPILVTEISPYRDSTETVLYVPFVPPEVETEMFTDWWEEMLGGQVVFPSWVSRGAASLSEYTDRFTMRKEESPSLRAWANRHHIEGRELTEPHGAQKGQWINGELMVTRHANVRAVMRQMETDVAAAKQLIKERECEQDG